MYSANWKADIAEWASNHGRDPSAVESILIRKGWDPSRYLPGMKGDLFHYLNEWYTLAVKKLPAPATSLRRNPVVLCDHPEADFDDYDGSYYCLDCGEVF